MHDTPAVWSTIVLERLNPWYTDRLSQCLKFSGTHPLDVYIRIYFAYTSLADMVPYLLLLNKEQQRIRLIVSPHLFQVEALALFPIDEDRSSKYISLRVLQIQRLEADLNSCPIGDLYTPNLRYLHLPESTALASFVAELLPIRFLDVWQNNPLTTALSVFGFLQRCPQLVFLHLGMGEDFSSTAYMVSPETRITLSLLRHLVFQSYGGPNSTILLRLLDLPALRELELGDLEGQISPDPFFKCELLWHLLPQISSTLIELTFHRSCLATGDHVIEPLLAGLTNMRTLSFIGLEMKQSFLELLIPVTDGAEQSCAMPHLYHLNLFEIDIEGDALIRLIKYRAPSDEELKLIEVNKDEFGIAGPHSHGWTSSERQSEWEVSVHMDSYIVYCEEETFSPSEALLSIPVSDASLYSTKPLKWIRYIMAAVVGCEGELATYTEDENDNEGQTRLPLNLEDTAPQHRNLCFTPQGPISFVDVDGLNHLKSSQFTTPSRAGFRDHVAERDRSSVINGVREEFCDACHLIPHSKGNQYIQTLCIWRTIAEDPEIENIDDIRNGILVTLDFHRFFGLSHLAVLRTPNFALSMDEVLPNPTYQNPSFRFTPHFFVPNPSDAELAFINPYRRDFRYPVDMVDEWPKDWPPAFLWDFIYGVIIVKKYGNQSAVDIAAVASKTNLYPEGIQTATERAEKNLERKKQENKRGKEEQDSGRDERAGRRGGDQDQLSFSDAADVVFCLWMNSLLGRSGQDARSKGMAERTRREQEESRMTSERVDKWRSEVVDSAD
ncbi:hypothetical protein BU17DRAFT_79576 [Hysterangium stoloniferum]|nr:hypothetical protein BU17DRAFT_79576 [Hysterangium stoloniferum]